MHTIETIALMLVERDDAVKRAITRLAEDGFADGPDAPFLADIARKLPLYQNRMTPPQMRRARRALAGYVERLVEIANERKGEAPKATAVAQVERDPELDDLWGAFA